MSVVSDPGLHFLPMPHTKDARLIYGLNGPFFLENIDYKIQPMKDTVCTFFSQNSMPSFENSVDPDQLA